MPKHFFSTTWCITKSGGGMETASAGAIMQRSQEVIIFLRGGKQEEDFIISL